MSNSFIYGLYDDKDELRYVGKARNCKTRLACHIRTSINEAKTRCANWIKSLLREGMVPTQKILETCESKLSSERERFYIKLFRDQGARLTNLTDGGEGSFGYHHTAEAKAKISKLKLGNKFWLGKTHSLVTRMKISLTRKGCLGTRLGAKHSEAARTKMSMARIGNKNCQGRKYSAETKEKMRTAKLGKKASFEARMKMSVSRKGKPSGRLGEKHSEESKRKMSESHLGNKSNLGRNLSDGHKEKIRMGLFLYNQNKRKESTKWLSLFS